MKVYLISDHRQIQELCQQIVNDMLGPEWALHAGSDLADISDADLCVWDIDSVSLDTLPVIETHKAWRHFFLVDRAAVEAFRSRLSFRETSILLKPVTRGALAAFLIDACSLCAQQRGAGTNSAAAALRADRDLLLQCFMQANLKLQEYDSDRTNFLARAIHDFRAPLTAITGYCGLMLADDAGHLSDQQREVLQRMHHCAHKLSRMASTMFQLSVWPRVDPDLDVRRDEIQGCIARAVHEVYPIAHEKRISISVDAAAPCEPLLFDGQKIEQVLVNLLENACKFVPRGGGINIEGYEWFWERRATVRLASSTASERRERADASPNSYRIDIRDNGPGISLADAPRIFEEYTSYAGGSDRSGGGLGLAICRMIISQHKGHIWAEPASSGALFSFVLPFDAGEAARIGAQTEKAFHAGAS